MKKEIQELVEYALTTTTNKKVELVIGKVSKKQAKEIEEIIGINLEGAERIIDSYMIRHALAEHGSPTIEKKRGQIAITLDDFEHVPTVLTSPDNIDSIGKNKLKQELVRYTKYIGDTYFIVEAIRVSKRGNKMIFTTMYKRK
ncbi:MAG: hypothetical protein R2807_11115 [Chitinophagales bacterium]